MIVHLIHVVLLPSSDMLSCVITFPLYSLWHFLNTCMNFSCTLLASFLKPGQYSSIFCTGTRQSVFVFSGYWCGKGMQGRIQD